MTYFTDLDPITSDEDIIDSRTVIARIEYLASLASDGILDEDEARELAALRELADDGETNVADWHYGATLVRESYFVTYAKQYAEDIGALDADIKWPHDHIDWEAAADELRPDYAEVLFDGVTYLAG